MYFRTQVSVFVLLFSGVSICTLVLLLRQLLGELADVLVALPQQRARAHVCLCLSMPILKDRGAWPLIEFLKDAVGDLQLLLLGPLSIRQHTSAYVSIRQLGDLQQHTSAYVSIR